LLEQERPPIFVADDQEGLAIDEGAQVFGSTASGIGIYHTCAGDVGLPCQRAIHFFGKSVAVKSDVVEQNFLFDFELFDFELFDFFCPGRYYALLKSGCPVLEHHLIP